MVVTPEARDQLNAIYDYIAEAASSEIAQRFVSGILDRLAPLGDFPGIGSPRDDLRPGLRTLSFHRRVTIAFMVEASAVVVTGFFYGGRDLDTLLRDD